MARLARRLVDRNVEALLEDAPGFELLADDLRQHLATRMPERRFGAGQVLVAEGDQGNALFLIADGRAEVSVGGTTVAALEPGDLVGEQALLHPDAERSATVKAITDLVTYELAREDFAAALAQHPEAHDALSAIGRELAIANFLAVATPLRSLGPAERRRLAARLDEREFAAGATIVRAGEPGSVAYLLLDGSAEAVATNPDGEARRLGTLQPGALFGELAVLTGEPRTASVLAVEPCRTLSLDGADLIDALARTPGAARDVAHMMRFRSRPRQAPGVEVFERTGRAGEPIAVLCDPARSAYFQLSDLGRFVWDRLDGEHNVRDLTLEYFEHRDRLAPLAIADLLTALDGAGFIDEPRRPPGESPDRKTGAWTRSMVAARRALEWNTSVRDTDHVVSAVYRVFRWAFTPAGVVAIALVAIAGFLAFVASASTVRAFRVEAGWALLLVVYPALVFAVVAHEAGHAIATKHYGRTVNRIGLGWYWFGPVAFVDTSDMWTAERWPRVAVSLAGTVASLLIAGLAGLAAAASPVPLLATAAWQVALISYIAVFVNLNPLLEFDGYYVLIDLLERPNLRSDALRWLGSGLPSQWRDPTALRRHRLELVYAAASVLFIVLGAFLTAVVYRAVISAWLEPLLGETATTVLGGLMVAAALGLPLLALAGDIRGLRHRTAAEGR